MVQRRTKPNISRVKHEGVSTEGDGVAQRKSVDPISHWAFLDEIEAPMWVDLNLEARTSYEDNEDAWFQISHPFHQYSSRQLISSFSHSHEGNANLDSGIEGLSSPKIPSSVSRSRGKHYRSRDWRQNNCEVESKKGHPVKNLTSKSLRMQLKSGEKINTKRSNRKQKGNARPKADSICKSTLTDASGPSYPKSSSGDSKTSSSSATGKEVENKSAGTVTSKRSEEVEDNSASTVTSESSKQQSQKSLDVSSQVVSHTSGLLSALKVTLRKSCVTRQASRAEVGGRRQSEGHKSSSGKSSVGSSSYPECDIRSTTFLASQNRDTTPDSRDVSRVLQATQDKAKVSEVSKRSTAKAQDRTAKSRQGGKITGAVKSNHSETAKLKDLPSNIMRLRRVNEQGSVPAAKQMVDRLGGGKYRRLGAGKENAMSQRSNKGSGGMVPVQKATKPVAPQKVDSMGLIVPKEKLAAKTKGKSLSNVTQKVQLR